MSRFAACLDHVLAHEGGYVDHPRDPGGATHHGITRRTLALWRGRPVSKAEVRALTRVDVAPIYRARYWDAVRGDALPPGVDLCVFDHAVNAGPRTAITSLQRTLGTAADGRIGPATLAAAHAAPARALIRALCRRRLALLGRLPIWPTFGRGWTRRVAAIEAAALASTPRPGSSARAPGAGPEGP